MLNKENVNDIYMIIKTKKNMTNIEIKLELAKALLLSKRECHSSLGEIYKWVTTEEKESSVVEPYSFFNDKPISLILDYQRGHLGVRKLEEVFDKYNVNTIGDLLRIGRANFIAMCDGKKNSIVKIDEALDNLYGMLSWNKQ